MHMNTKNFQFNNKFLKWALPIVYLCCLCHVVLVSIHVLLIEKSEWK